ncbi:MAG TPA: metal ABC transporter substrate-binding protein [Microlunatus sp.]
MVNIPRALGAVALGCSLLLAAACGTAGEPASAQPGQLKIVTAFYPLQFVAERVAGHHGAVSSLTQPGAEPHDVELTPRQVASVSDADAVVYIKGFQPAVDEAIAQSGNDHVLDTTGVVPLQTEAEERAHDHADDSPTSEHDADEHAEEGHDHGGLDPHVWLNPLNMVTTTDAVVAQLSEIDPDHAADYRANGTALEKELKELDGAYAAGLKTCDRREFITSHAAFGYLAEQYGLTQIGISGLTPDAEPSPARIAAVQREAKSHGVTTIFYEILVSPAVATSIAGDLGLTTDVLDPIEAVTAESRGDNYIAVMQSNLTALEKANGCR